MKLVESNFFVKIGISLNYELGGIFLGEYKDPSSWYFYVKHFLMDTGQ